ncbi:MAG TPA: hypothetical protein VGL74_07525 [Terriglobales bacterium]
MSTMRTISLPEELCMKAEQKFRHRYQTVDEFVIAVMTELLRDDATRMDVIEQKIIEERLKGLGYI